MTKKVENFGTEHKQQQNRSSSCANKFSKVQNFGHNHEDSRRQNKSRPQNFSNPRKTSCLGGIIDVQEILTVVLPMVQNVLNVTKLDILLQYVGVFTILKAKELGVRDASPFLDNRLEMGIVAENLGK